MIMTRMGLKLRHCMCWSTIRASRGASLFQESLKRFQETLEISRDLVKWQRDSNEGPLCCARHFSAVVWVIWMFTQVCRRSVLKPRSKVGENSHTNLDANAADSIFNVSVKGLLTLPGCDSQTITHARVFQSKSAGAEFVQKNTQGNQAPDSQQRVSLTPWG